MWGIDIGDAALKAVNLKRVSKQIVLQDFHVIRYSEAAGDPGARRNGNARAALEELRRRGLGKEPCFISIAPQAVFSRFISLPPVDKRRIPEIVLYEARQQIPFSLDEVIWAYQTVREQHEPGDEIEIGLFAVKREVVDAYLQELDPIARQIEGIQVGPLALHSFVCRELNLEKPSVLLDVGAQSTDLLVIEGEKFWMRNLPIAGNSFTNILEKRLNIPRSEAEKLKLGVAESRHRRKILEVLRPAMRDLVAEIQRSIGYYKSLSQEVKFERILIMGEGYRLFGLDRFLADQLRYEIEPVGRLENLPWQGPAEREEELNQHVGSLGPAIGLALQGLGEARGTINLLPDDFVIRRELHKKRVLQPLVAAVLVWGIVLCFWLKESRGISDMEGLSDYGRPTLSQRNNLAQELSQARRILEKSPTEQYRDRGKHREHYARVIRALASTITPRYTIRGGFQIGPGGQGGMEPGMGGRVDMPGATMGRYGGEGRLQDWDKNTKNAKLVVSFDVLAKGQERVLKEDLPAILKTAAIYPENMPIVTGVDISPVRRETISEMRDGVRVPAEVLTAQVRVGVYGPDEVPQKYREYLKALDEEARRRAAEKEAAEAAEAAAETGAEGAEAGAVPEEEE
jgi:type IV pilus assembly protein PilM